MSNSELSNLFDVLVNSYRRFKDFDDREIPDSLEFDEFEKSLYLTKSQEELALSLYNGRNSSLQGFEETEELRRYLSDLIGEAELSPLTSTSGKQPQYNAQTGIMDISFSGQSKIVPNAETGIIEFTFPEEKTGFKGISSKSRFFSLPDDLWFITYEAVIITDGKCEDTTTLEVIPVTQDEYHRLRKNPFRGANDRRALRLDLSENVVEIVSKYSISVYYVRYLRKLSPIVLEDMPEGVSVNGVSTATGCKMHESLHQKIVENAVIMALRSKGYNIKENNSENR